MRSTCTSSGRAPGVCLLRTETDRGAKGADLSEEQKSVALGGPGGGGAVRPGLGPAAGPPHRPYGGGAPARRAHRGLGDEKGLQSHPLDQETQEELYRLLSDVRLSWRGRYAYIEYVEGVPIITVTFRGEERYDFHLTGDGYLYLDGTRYIITGGDGGDLYARLMEETEK